MIALSENSVDTGGGAEGMLIAGDDELRALLRIVTAHNVEARRRGEPVDQDLHQVEWALEALVLPRDPLYCGHCGGAL